MSIKPILFNTEMVRANLDGRKSCTRRVIKPQPQARLCYTYAGSHNDGIGKWTYPNKGSHEFWGEEYKLPENIMDEELSKRWNPPYQTGDILYVRETVWQKTGHYLDVDGETKAVWCNEFRYAASDEKPEVGWNYSWAKRPSIHMPKEAARIFLKVTDVRIERLQDVTEDGAKAEGAIDNRGFIHSPENEYDRIHTAREHFIKIWNSTIKKSDIDRYGWNANPWVWVIEFERCEKPEGV